MVGDLAISGLSHDRSVPTVLIAGDGRSAIHERAIEGALDEQGWHTHLFTWHQYVNADRSGSLLSRGIAARLQSRFVLGPAIARLNRDLQAAAKKLRPQLVFVYRGAEVWPDTIAKLRQGGAIVFGYNNDDPFGKAPPFYWRHFRRALASYDHLFAYRPKNIADYQSLGLSEVSLLRSYYVRGINFPVAARPDRKYSCDVLFAGHYERDGREVMLERLVEAGVYLRVMGPEWERYDRAGSLATAISREVPRGSEYNLALNSAKIALVFLSRLNNDSYTRRCFEIPATKTFMLAEYSSDLASLYEEGIEAEYFRTPSELLAKVRHYLANPAEREQIAEAGYARLIRDGHEAADRARQITSTYERLTGEREAAARKSPTAPVGGRAH